MNYNTYDVAIMNYPLLDKRENTDNLQDKIFDCQIKEDFEAPIYIHIPFCNSLCDFCIYSRILAPKNNDVVGLYVEALVKEIQLYASYEYIKKQKIGSVFLGGGTPTVLSEKELYKIITTLNDCFNIKNGEITVECNVNNADLSKLKMLRRLGVTRISTGVQSFDDVVRKSLHMQNSGKEILNWLEQSKALGFEDVSIDLIYGFPETDAKHFLFDVEEAARLDLGHISLYKLTVFAYTKLYKSIQNGEISCLPAEEQMYEMFIKSHDFLLSNNYTVESTQEYSKMGRSVKFWELTYDGYGNNISFGSSSFGYINGYCYQNETKVDRYINKIDLKMLPIERISPRITNEQQMERAMVIGFRKGAVSKTLFYEAFKMQISDVFPRQIEKQLNNGYICEDREGYYLTSKGLYHQGLISADYMISVFKNVSFLKKKMCVGMHEMP